MEDNQREDLLKKYVRRKISSGHYEVFDEAPFEVFIRSTRKVNHILQLLLSVVTLGWWIPVWLIMSLQVNKVYHIWIQENGTISEERWN